MDSNPKVPDFFAARLRFVKAYTIEVYENALLSAIDDHESTHNSKPDVLLIHDGGENEHHMLLRLEDVLKHKSATVVGKKIDDFFSEVGFAKGFDICAICSDDSLTIAKSFHAFIDHPCLLLAPLSGSHVERQGLYVVSIAKAGTHLLFGLLSAMGVGADPRSLLNDRLPPSKGKWKSILHRHQHLSANNFFKEMANEPFGGVLHPVFQHPVLFMYRNPRDILVSESHYYRNPRNTALGYYYQGMSQEECLISLLSKGGAIDCFADRMASYLPWFRLGNVIPVSYEELVGSKGGGSDSERLATIWSLQLKLGIEGRPADFAGLLNNSSDISRTFRKGSIGQHQDVFSANVWAEIEKQESDYMPGFGYSLGREADMPYPLYMANYRSRGLMLETPAREELPAEPVVVDTYEEWNIIEFRGVFYGLALSAGHVDFFDNDRLTTLALTGDLIECSGYPDVVDVLRQKKSKLELDMVVKYMNDVERRVAMLERGGQHNQDHPFISLLMPTRGRPDWVERFFRSVIEHTARIDRVEVILYVDDDDRGSHHLGNSEVRVVRIIGPRMSMGAYNSACLERAQGDIVILVNDDMVIKTHGWDEAVATMDASFSDGIYLAYGNDLFKGGRLCTFPIISRRTCEILIEPYPKEYRGAFIDYHLFDIFKRLQHAGYDRIRYLEDVVFEHLHFRAGKAEADETYAKRGRFDDDAIFLGLTALREQSAKRLLNVLQEKTTLVYEAVEVVQKDVPPKILQLLFYLTKNFLLDTKLPFKWRFFLWYWFVGRSFAARGLLGPFVKN